MADNSEYIAAIDEAIRSGVRRVTTPGGLSTEFRSIDEMLKVRRMLTADDDLTQALGKTRPASARIILGNL